MAGVWGAESALVSETDNLPLEERKPCSDTEGSSYKGREMSVKE